MYVDVFNIALHYIQLPIINLFFNREERSKAARLFRRRNLVSVCFFCEKNVSSFHFTGENTNVKNYFRLTNYLDFFSKILIFKNFDHYTRTLFSIFRWRYIILRVKFGDVYPALDIPKADFRSFKPNLDTSTSLIWVSIDNRPIFRL